MQFLQFDFDHKKRTNQQQRDPKKLKPITTLPEAKIHQSRQSINSREQPIQEG
ncbi:hypothetical protein SynPROSU1_02431 [Synechococcus sp. PROS-U-1]|nr:hypothetical protein SynPROSU1_02431 [Synechococcus sp. PROS-U-1]